MCIFFFIYAFFSVFHSKSFSNHKQEFDDGPIKYSSSAASNYKAKQTRTGIADERLWYEPYVIFGSLTLFLVYFCILREENDIDKELNQDLYTKIGGLEESQLRLSLKYNQDNGKDTSAILNRLAEIEQEKEKALNG